MPGLYEKTGLSIRTRLALQALILFLLTALACFYFLTKANDARTQFKIREDLYHRTDILNSFLKIQEDVFPAYMKAFEKPDTILQADIDDGFEKLFQQTDDLSEYFPEKIKTVEHELGHAIQLFHTSRAEYIRHNHSLSNKKLHESYLAMKRARRDIRSLVDDVDVQVTQFRINVRPMIEQSLYAPPWILVGCFLTMLIFGIILMVDIFIPLQSVAQQMTAASQDIPNARRYWIKKIRRDEIGATQRALNDLLTHVEESIRAIQDANILSRKRLAAVESARDGIGIIDAQGNLTYANQAIFQLHGIENKSISEYIGHSWQKVFCMENAENVVATLGEKGFWKGESSFLHKDGRLIYTEKTLTRLEDGGFICTSRDITERKRSESEKEELQRQFLQAQKMEVMGRLTGGIAHDFNNMLTVIRGNMDLMQDYVADIPAMDKFLTTTRRAVMRGTELTQRLLAFSRNQILDPYVVNINKIIPETAMFIIRAIGEKIEIVFDLEENIWNTKVDIGQFENALLNIAINARDAMPDGGTITIKTRNAVLDEKSALQSNVTPGRYVMTEIVDTGCGVPPDIIGRVFDPFFTTKDVGSGSGLGLSMVYGFVTQSKGFITLDSQVGIGTKIRLYFPWSDSALSQDIRSYGADKIENLSGGHETILVVEDEEELLLLDRDFLSRLGYTVYCARNGREALALLPKIDGLSLLVTDIAMSGGISGIDLAREVQQKMPNLSILLVSGHEHTLSPELTFLSQSSDFLPKPYSPAQLATKVRYLLDLKESIKRRKI